MHKLGTLMLTPAEPAATLRAGLIAALLALLVVVLAPHNAAALEHEELASGQVQLSLIQEGSFDPAAQVELPDYWVDDDGQEPADASLAATQGQDAAEDTAALAPTPDADPASSAADADQDAATATPDATDPTGANAAASPSGEAAEEAATSPATAPHAASAPSNDQLARLRARLNTAFMNVQQTVSVADLGVYMSKEELGDFLSSIINTNPDLFYFTGVVDYQYYVPAGMTKSDVTDTTSTRLHSITPTYSPGNAVDVANAKRSFEGKMGEMLSWVPEGATQVQKAKAIHDYLVINCSYNKQAAEILDSPSTWPAGKTAADVYYARYGTMSPWNAYGALAEGQPVCEGISLAFLAAMNRLGIPCTYVAQFDASGAGHGWNRVCLNGKWYNLDLTFDDGLTEAAEEAARQGSNTGSAGSGTSGASGSSSGSSGAGSSGTGSSSAASSASSSSAATPAAIAPNTTYFLKSDAWWKARANWADGRWHGSWEPVGQAATDTAFDTKASWDEVYTGPASVESSVQSFALSETDLTLSCDDSAHIDIVNLQPETANRGFARWSSSNPQVVAVDSAGRLSTGISAGYAQVSCTLGGITHTVAVTVRGGDMGTIGLDRSVTPASYTYDTFSHRPTIRLTHTTASGTIALTEGTDYTLSWPDDTTNVGECAVTVTGTGDYRGQTSVTFTINKAASSWERLAGAGALDTMRRVVQTGFARASTVVIADNSGYWDALAASSLAGKYGAPVLLTDTHALSPQTRAEIKRLGATRALICGGTLSVSSKVEGEIRAAGCTTVQRINGTNAAGTARAIAAALGATRSNCAIIATVETYQDALSVAPYAYATQSPIFLTDASGKLDTDTLAIIRNGGFSSALIAGGTYYVSNQVEAQLTAVGVPHYAIERRWGANAYETSGSIAEWEIGQGLNPNKLGIATGEGFWDALTGAALCGKNRSVLLLADDANMSNIKHLETVTDAGDPDYGNTVVRGFVAEHKNQIIKGYVYGGTFSVGESTMRTAQETTR